MSQKAARREPAPPPPFSANLDYLLAVAASWLVPGLGHWFMGHRVKAIILGTLLLGTFWGGEFASKGYAVTRLEHPYWFYGQVGCGISAIVANRLQWGEEKGEVTRREPPGPFGKEIDRLIPRHLALGILLTTVSGLLNMLLVLHVMDPASWEVRRAGGVADGERRKP